jgi:hypothetical protein
MLIIKDTRASSFSYDMTEERGISVEKLFTSIGLSHQACETLEYAITVFTAMFDEEPLLRTVIEHSNEYERYTLTDHDIKRCWVHHIKHNTVLKD